MKENAILTYVLNGVGIVAGVVQVVAGYFYKGYLRQGYEKGFESLGFDKKTGNLVYGGVDIALSGYGLLRNILKPEISSVRFYLQIITLLQHELFIYLLIAINSLNI
ncbi:hypothetical protein C5470_01935 [Photorhabdus stackebrandtii]|uniref:Uncharacterized protein n=1 Tax=Photorhabdus stackebrandtii TaxID=1123042 RepID=A0A7X5TK34_9GAMM|nr:hypothetical protein [Photorhabdus stackebrandtii]